MNIKRIGKRLILIALAVVSVIIGGIYILSILAAFIPPRISVIPSILTLYTPIWVLLLALLIIVYPFCKRWLEPIILLVLLLAGFKVWGNSCVVFPQKNGDIQGKEIKIVTYNIMSFWGCKPNEVLDFMQSIDADIICFEEMPRRTFSLRGIDAQFDKTYPYSVVDNKKHELAIYSKYPIISSDFAKFSCGSGELLTSHIQVGDVVIALITTHLESYRMSMNDRQIIDKAVGGENGEVKQSLFRLLKQMRVTFPVRAIQAKELKAAIDNEDHPVVVVGDFNDVPTSYSFNTIAKGRTSAYAAVGRNILPYTYNQYGLLFLIDHIIVDKSFKVKSSRIYKVENSDHLPLAATIVIP